MKVKDLTYISESKLLSTMETLKGVWEDRKKDYPLIRLGWDLHNEWNQVKQFRDPDEHLCQEVLKCEQEAKALERGFANIPSIGIDFGGVAWLISSAYGCDIIEIGHLINTKPLIHEPDEVYRITKPEVVKQGLCKKVLERLEFFQKSLNGKVFIRCADIQSPIDVATQIWHCEDLLACMYTHPKAVHYLLDLVTDSIIEFLKAQKAMINNFYGFNASPIWISRGVHLSDDDAAFLSPSTYEEFAKPYAEKLSQEFGGVFIHCCMKYEQNFEVISTTNGFMGFDPNPNYNDIKKILKNITGKGVWQVFLDKKEIGEGLYDRALKIVELTKGKIGTIITIFAETEEEAFKLGDRIRKHF